MSLYISLYNYLNLLDNGRRGPKHAAHYYYIQVFFPLMQCIFLIYEAVTIISYA